MKTRPSQSHRGSPRPSIADSIAFIPRRHGRDEDPPRRFDLEEQGVKVCFVDTPGADGAIERQPRSS